MAAPKLKAVGAGPRRPSKMEPGKASAREKTRFIVLYGGPKCRKTTATSTLRNAKWLISDSNCIPTLEALDRLPHPDDTYEVDSLYGAIDWVSKMLDICEKDGVEAIGCDVVAVDSMTQFSDWHQQDIAKESGQRYMGDNAKNNGWQQFNAQFGNLIDLLGQLSKYVTVVAICHAKEKPDMKKGEWAGLNLPPQMALKLGRTANWVLFQTIRNFTADKDESDDFVTVKKAPDGTLRATEVVINTQPLGLWIASANAKNLDAEEPGDIDALLRKAGLVK